MCFGMSEILNETVNTSLSGVVGEAVNSTVNNTAPLLLGKVVPILTSPVYDIACFALIGALFTTLVNKFLSDQVAIKVLRKDMKKLQKKIRETMKEDPKKAQALQAEVMKKNLENMKHAMNPKIMLTTMIPMLFLFFIIRTHYSHLGEFWNLGFTTFGWLGTYLVCSILWSILLKKVLDVA